MHDVPRGPLRRFRWVLANYDSHNGPLLAKGLAFSLLIGAVPLLFFPLALRGYLGNPGIQDFIAEQLLFFLPLDIRRDFLEALTELSTQWQRLPGITILVFVVASFNLFENLERAMSTMLGADRRRFWLGRLVSFVLTAAAIPLSYAAALVSSILRLVAEGLTARPELLYASAKVASGLLTALLLTGLYYLFARRGIRFGVTFAVAIACAVIWQLVGLVGGWLVRQAGSRFLIYGAAASAVIALIFLRFLAEIIVVSSSIVAALSPASSPRPASLPPADSPTAPDASSALAKERRNDRVRGNRILEYGGPMANDTIFDKILTKEIPSEVVFQDKEVYAFKDINPQAPIHVLVLPKQRMERFPDVKDADSQAVGRFIQGVARVAQELGLEENGYRVVFNIGKHGQQSVEYLHAHIIGGRQLKWPPG